MASEERALPVVGSRTSIVCCDSRHRQWYLRGRMERSKQATMGVDGIDGGGELEEEGNLWNEGELPWL